MNAKLQIFILLTFCIKNTLKSEVTKIITKTQIFFKVNVGRIEFLLKY